MIYDQNTKKKVLIAPASVGTTAVTGMVDTRGHSYLTVDYIGATAAAGALPAALKLGESDSTQNFTDITGAVGGTDAAGGFTIPAIDTANPQIVSFKVDLRGRKRYVQLSVTGTATARLTSAIATLSRSEQLPRDKTEQNVAAVIVV
jgi:hypothetical protein